ncbi:monofunctional biosynthetic peptidoglycan transglycosylase [Agrobacterium sp. ATCC 31749]|nr:monofunctional biosynthetic peptidoglycan transglycosylase [Agrobacterium sp. ATCC 31749]
MRFANVRKSTFGLLRSSASTAYSASLSGVLLNIRPRAHAN